MDFDDPDQREAFFALHSELPREAPGSPDSLERAIALSGIDRTAALRVLDIGCGPGAQTIQLTEALPRATILAVDLHEPYLEEVRRRAREAGVADRVETLAADMAKLGLPEQSFDLVWCEGAAYVMGFAEALRAWRPLLRSGGRMAVNDAIWLRADPPEAVRRFWAAYPTMTDVAGCRACVEEAGFDLLGDFVLPERAWWDDYYRPLERRIAELREERKGDPAVEIVLAEHEEEIAMYRDHSDCYGYMFLVMEPTLT